jgi:hypothetical protein
MNDKLKSFAREELKNGLRQLTEAQQRMNGDRVITPDGPGIIIGQDLPGSNLMRFIVKLDEPQYDFEPCYFPKELHDANFVNMTGGNYETVLGQG